MFRPDLLHLVMIYKLYVDRKKILICTANYDVTLRPHHVTLIYFMLFTLCIVFRDYKEISIFTI